MRFLVGGNTAEKGGSATGIGMLVAGAADDVLAGGPLGFVGDAAATGGSPSWVTPHPSLNIVYAALETAGSVQAFRRTGDASFSRHGDPVEAGGLVCHVAVAPDGAALVASCWEDGRVVRMTLDAAGRPGAPVAAAAAVDPHARHEAAPASDPDIVADLDLAAAARALRDVAGDEYAHLIPAVPEARPVETAANAVEPPLRRSRAHQARFLPDGLIATTDMGFDLVRLWRAGANGLVARQQIVLPAGSGPRHMVWHPSGYLYVVTELSHEVFVLAPDAAGTWHLVAGTPLGAGVLRDDTAAELCVSRDGQFLYAGVRGSNTIATLRVRGDGSTVSPVAVVEAGVDWPRHHVVIRDTLLVAGQRSDEVASLTLDLRTGVPQRVRHRAAVPSPTCLVPVSA